MTLSVNGLFCIIALRLKQSRQIRIHNFDCFDRYTGGLGLETIAVCHEKHFLVQVMPETITAESGICDTMINKH